jgi:hypothetical protein
MKTAMQEFLDYMKEYNIILVKEGIEPNLLIKMLQHKAEKLLEQEKEQIIDAYDNGMHDVDNKYYNIIQNGGETYYNQTYNQEETLEEWKSKFTHHCAVKNNQKQHIIDIMKADEDDGLYKTFDTDPDKKH